ncbi:hypothetical protein QYE76_037241 [Lolium multiflorum]|uniref:lactoylglutathione lyase n=1 Tax=Lolium multiflorum TaxID=4521 RepID=A0AAD8PHZ6_LOLMU|nr:hypothetical protein QYE76_037241 [Lolium multiflorum]
MAAASLRSALLSSSSSSPAAALRRLSSAPRAPRFAQPKRFDRVRRFSPAAAMSTSSGTKDAPANNPGLQAEIDPATKGYFMQQTMFRVKDPKVSLDFYSRVMGMSLLKRLDFPDMKFSLYFLGYEDLSAAPADPVKRTEWTFGQKATIELTHNWGTETDPEFKGYHNGNSDPRGFGMCKESSYVTLLLLLLFKLTMNLLAAVLYFFFVYSGHIQWMMSIRHVSASNVLG